MLFNLIRIAYPYSVLSYEFSLLKAIQTDIYIYYIYMNAGQSGIKL